MGATGCDGSGVTTGMDLMAPERELQAWIGPE